MIVNQLIIKLKDTIVMEITKNKITEIFCIIDDFCQEYDKEIARMSICEPDGRKHRNRKSTMSRSEIMTILIYFHFNTFRNFQVLLPFLCQGSPARPVPQAAFI